MADAFALIWPPLVWGGKHAKRDVFFCRLIQIRQVERFKVHSAARMCTYLSLNHVKVYKIQTESSALYAFMVSCGISSEWEFPHGHHKFYFSPLPSSKWSYFKRDKILCTMQTTAYTWPATRLSFLALQVARCSARVTSITSARPLADL